MPRSAAADLSQAGSACRQLGPNLRGFLPPLPWVAPDAPIPPAAAPEESDGDEEPRTGADAAAQPPEASHAGGEPATTDEAPADDAGSPEGAA